MNHHFITVEEFNRLIHQWTGHTIKIMKHELDDVDETCLHLDHISYATNTRRIDDYEAMHALHLNGGGAIQTDKDPYTLPDDLYKIPLQDTTLYEYDGYQFLISTDRGVYKIELVE
ncbi:hypothetical protein [Virgibacillus alimentarius]|uniref:Uncharacterized protein n=1 Tax=Virgibacillus alimentarius TaxID=698769 RepID=A0ABS4SA72_9BACI|nr:hypothetical protein [Virgibacillus alimentarius]MBP2258393.1 hypothetical protein [Virgibacillus alimentarius]